MQHTTCLSTSTSGLARQTPPGRTFHHPMPAGCTPYKRVAALPTCTTQPVHNNAFVAQRGRHAFHSSKRLKTTTTRIVKLHAGSTGAILGRDAYAILRAQRRGDRIVVAATMVGSEAMPMNADAILGKPLDWHPDLRQGQLDNGLQYVLLPNKIPPERFEAHLEIHAGSVDENEHEQGVAHLVEHVTFLGSRKREALLGTGARSNAYTDFHHTVFHVHSPKVNVNTGNAMLPQVLDALVEIAFEPEFLPTRIEKERRAVLSEAQMMNTIEYRVDCQLLQYLHNENALGCRFPIGKTDQVKQWEASVLKNYWSRWYFPANATLYVVGDMDGGLDATEALIKQTFGRIPPGRHPLPAGPATAAALENSAAVLAAGAAAVATNGGGGPSPMVGPLKERHPLRPPVAHRFGRGKPDGWQMAPVSVFRHRLLQHFMLSVFCKLPIKPIQNMRDLRHAFMVRVLLSVLQFRFNQRYVAGTPPFRSIEFDHSDSGREGCAVSTLTITSEPRDWRGAVQVAVEEVRKLQLYGVTAGELERYKSALLKDSEQLAEQAGSVPSVENLDFTMDSLAQGHVVMDQKQGHAAMLALADTISLVEINGLARSLLSYVSHFGREEDAWAEYTEDPEAWSDMGPTYATAIVACIPAFMDDSGLSTGNGPVLQRGATLTTMEHMDGSVGTLTSDFESESDDDVPEGAVRFELEAEEIQAALLEVGGDVAPPLDVEVPNSLLPHDELEALIAQRQPRFVALDGSEDGNPFPPSDVHTGVTQRRLANGVRVNYRHTSNEPRAAWLRLVAAGGRILERSELGPDGPGVITVGTRTLSESGTVGQWDRQQVELFCISKLINCVLESDEEFIIMDFHFAVGDGGLQSVLELLFLFLEQPRWEESAMERAKQMFVSHYRSLAKTLERATADRVVSAMMGPDRRVRDPTPEEIGALSLEAMQRAIMRQLQANNIEVTVVGDFDEQELLDGALRYLGCLTTHEEPPMRSYAPLVLQDPPMALRQQVWHLKDSDERAVAYIAGKAPSRWGSFGAPSGTPIPQQGQVQPPILLPANATPQQAALATTIRRAHPLYPMITLSLLTEILNSRLFTTVRDALGLTYDVSFELNLFDRLDAGWFVVHVTSTPQKIHEALGASLNVLRQLDTMRVTLRELQRAQRTLITRHDSELKDNSYWLGLLTHLQSPSVPYKSLDCLRDLRVMFESVTLDDIYQAYEQFDFRDGAIFTCVGTSGTEPPALASAQQAGGVPDASGTDPVLIRALAAAVQGMNLAKAIQTIHDTNKNPNQQQQ